MEASSSAKQHEGHRECLRSRFLASPQAVSAEELIELILTYAIPRRDVAPLAHQLFEAYGAVW